MPARSDSKAGAVPLAHFLQPSLVQSKQKSLGKEVANGKFSPPRRKPKELLQHPPQEPPPKRPQDSPNNSPQKLPQELLQEQPRELQEGSEKEDDEASYPTNFQSSLQSPKPRVPVGWIAIFDGDQQQYYFWHKPTNFTTWEAPQVQEVCVDAAQAAKNVAEERARQRHRITQIQRMIDMTNCSGKQANDLLEKYCNLEAAFRAYTSSLKEHKAESPTGKELSESHGRSILQRLAKEKEKAEKAGVVKASSAWAQGPGSAASLLAPSRSSASGEAPLVELEKETEFPRLGSTHRKGL